MRKGMLAKTLWIPAVFCLVLGGCKLGNTEVVLTSEFAENEVFRIGEESCFLPAAKVFLANYQNIYGSAYGVDLWEHDFGDNSLEEYVKELTLAQLAKITSMELLAKEQEVSLTEEETAQMKKAAEEYYGSLNDAEKAYMNADIDCITDLYQKYGLANKLYDQLTERISDEVSDDDARIMEAYQIFVTTREQAEAVAAGLKAGTDFLTLAGTYNEAEEVKIAFGKGELPGKVETAAFSLEPDAVTEAIETDGGYYFIKCINNYNQELTDANKQVILKQRRQEAFDAVYDPFVESVSSKLNEELWNSVKIQVSDEISTRSFFEVYEKYIH